MLFLNNGFINYTLFSDYLEATKTMLLEIYADNKQIKRTFGDKLAYRGISSCISPYNTLWVYIRTSSEM